MSTTMTTIASVLSAKALATADIMDVASACILLTADMMSALTRARMADGHEIMTMLRALNVRFRNITSDDGTTSYVPATAKDDVPAPDTFAKKVDPTPVPAPRVNDIDVARNRIMMEIASQKRMKRKAALAYIGRTDGADILDTLVKEGKLIYVERGRLAGYGLAEKPTVRVGLTDAEFAMVSAAVLASYAADADTVASIDAQSGEGLPNVKPKKRPGRPRKNAPAPVITPEAPPAPTTDDIPVGWDDSTTTVIDPAPVVSKGEDKPTPPAKKRPTRKAKDKGQDTPKTDARPTLADAVATVKSKQTSHADSAELLDELQRRVDALIIGAQDHVNADKLIAGLRRLLTPTTDSK